MKEIIIFGIGEFSKLLTFLIEKQKTYEILAYTADAKYIDSKTFCNKEIIDFDKLEERFSMQKCEILIAVTQKEMNRQRQIVFERCKKKGYKIASFFDESATIDSNCIGEGNIVLFNSYIGPFCTLGKGNILMENVLVPHYNEIGDFNFLTNCKLSGNTIIKNNCFCGSNSVINNNVVVDDYTLVGAGAYVPKNTEKYSVIVPARSIVLEGKKSIDLM